MVRSADIACRVGGDEFAVILPESALPDAGQLYRRVQFTVSGRPIGPFERADEALYQSKEAGKGQFMAADEVG